MNDLSRLAQELVKAGRSAGAPTDADKERIREALQQRLAAPFVPEPEPSAAAGPVASGAPWSLIAGGTLVAAVVVGVLVWGSSGEMSAPPATSAAMPASSVAPPPRTPPPAPPPRTEETRMAPPASRAAEPPAAASAKVPTETRPKHRLAEEVALLSRATTALHAGRAQDALNALAEHQRQFPRGHLSLERVAARAQALCQLGRQAEAERELSRLPPSSPQAARARRACGSD